MNIKTLIAIDSYTRFFSQDAASSPEKLALTHFYIMLRDIVESKLLPSNLPGRESEVHLPRPLQELNRRAREAFQADHNGEMKQRLADLVAYLESEDSLQRLAESRLVLLKARDWLRCLQGRLTPGSFTVSLAPSLDLTMYEEDLTKEGEAGQQLLVTMAWLYEGPLPATEIRVFFEGHELEVRAEGQEKRVNNQRFVPADTSVADGEILTTSFRLRHFGAGRLRCRLQFTNYLPKRTALPGPIIDYVIDIAQITHPARLSNPFVPDSPLNSDVLWDLLAKGRHAQHVDRLTAELSVGTRFLALRGLRRSGKTTILLRTCQALGKLDQTLPVYINIHSWELALKKQNSAISGRGLLYEIADSALNAAELLGIETKRCNEFLQPFEEEMRLREPRQFDELLRLLRKETGRLPIFVLDDLDALLDKRHFVQDASILLRFLRDLADLGLCSLVAAHTWSDGDWLENLGEQNVFPGLMLLEMLNKQEVLELVSLAQFPVTRLAGELIWRLTGGWPGLLQLLLYAIYEECCSNRSAVDTAVVKKVSSELLRLPDWYPLIRHLLDSFRPSESRIIREMTAARLVSLETTALDKVHITSDKSLVLSSESELHDGWSESTLSSLIDKQILEATAGRSNRLRLRVGLLCHPQLSNLLPADSR